MANMVASNDQAVSHNLLGQRLGRKGRGTRERILAATARLLEDGAEGTISLSAVAREASLGMTTLYLYFADLTELLLAVLEPIMASAEASYVAHLRERWSDDRLAAECLRFVISYHAFWQRHSRILHLRNMLADTGDERMLAHRIDRSMPLINLLIRQMDSDPARTASFDSAMATVLLTSVERVITVATDVRMIDNLTDDPQAYVDVRLQAQARLLEFGISDRRTETPEATA